MDRVEATRHVMNIIDLPIGESYTVPNKTTSSSFYNSMMQRIARADRGIKVKCYTLDGNLVVVRLK